MAKIVHVHLAVLDDQNLIPQILRDRYQIYSSTEQNDKRRNYSPLLETLNKCWVSLTGRFNVIVLSGYVLT
jgi:hypothetical protein